MPLKHALRQEQELAEGLRGNREVFNKRQRPGGALETRQQRNDAIGERPQEVGSLGLIRLGGDDGAGIDRANRRQHHPQSRFDLFAREARLLDQQRRLGRFRDHRLEPRIGLAGERQQAAIEEVTGAGLLVGDERHGPDRRIKLAEQYERDAAVGGQRGGMQRCGRE